MSADPDQSSADLVRPGQNPENLKELLGFGRAVSAAVPLRSYLRSEPRSPPEPCVQAEWTLLFSWISTTPRRVVVNASLHLPSTSLHSA